MRMVITICPSSFLRWDSDHTTRMVHKLPQFATLFIGRDPYLTYSGELESINSVIESYGAANNIPVINYGDALCGCVGSILIPLQPSDIGIDVFGTYGGGPYIVPTVNPVPFSPKYVVSPTGYNLMTQQRTP
jgi:hypothetical protein